MNGQWRWRIYIANLDPVVGSEQAGTRPVLIVSEEEYNEIMPLVTIMPLTSRKRERKLYADEVLLGAGTAGLRMESLVLVHHVRTISKHRLQTLVGRLDDPDKQQEIIRAIGEHFGLW